VVLSERAGDGGPRLQFARDKKNVQGRIAIATREAAKLSSVSETSFAGSPKGPLRGAVVKEGLYGQRSETCESACCPEVEEVSFSLVKRMKHLCFPCVRQQVGSEASVIASYEEKASNEGPTDSKSRNRAHRRLIPSRLICGFICICRSPKLVFGQWNGSSFGILSVDGCPKSELLGKANALPLLPTLDQFATCCQRST